MEEKEKLQTFVMHRKLKSSCPAHFVNKAFLHPCCSERSNKEVNFTTFLISPSVRDASTCINTSQIEVHDCSSVPRILPQQWPYEFHQTSVGSFPLNHLV